MANSVDFFAINADGVPRARQFYSTVYSVGTSMIGFECTISVDDIDQTIRAIEANDGTLAASEKQT